MVPKLNWNDSVWSVVAFVISWENFGEIWANYLECEATEDSDGGVRAAGQSDPRDGVHPGRSVPKS